MNDVAKTIITKDVVAKKKEPFFEYQEVKKTA